MFEVILAVNKNWGIGYKNNLPWNCPEDLKIFREKTLNHIIVVGRNTCDSLPYLKNREVICLSTNRDKNPQWKNKVTIVDSIYKVYPTSDKTIFICGGAKVYNSILSIKNFIDTIHLSIINDENKCDTFVNKNLFRNFITEKVEAKTDQFTHYILRRSHSDEYQYLNLLRELLIKSNEREGRNGITSSLFVRHMEFDLTRGYPLLTTKKMWKKGIVEEFLFFVKGATDSTALSDKKVRIWEGNTSEEFIKSRNLPYKKGVMGPMYGYQWRFFGAKYTVDTNGVPQATRGGIDQLQKVIDLIKKDPHSRRIIMTSYNPAQAEEGVLYPCHSITIQFYVQNDYLDMFCYNRSQDFFLGVPYNIASSSLLLMTVAKLTGKKPRYLKMSMGDTHLYSEHYSAALRQVDRIPFNFPTLSFPDISSLSDLEKLESKDFKLKDYKSHPKIMAKMAV